MKDRGDLVRLSNTPILQAVAGARDAGVAGVSRLHHGRDGARLARDAAPRDAHGRNRTALELPARPPHHEAPREPGCAPGLLILQRIQEPRPRLIHPRGGAGILSVYPRNRDRGTFTAGVKTLTSPCPGPLKNSKFVLRPAGSEGPILVPTLLNPGSAEWLCVQKATTVDWCPCRGFTDKFVLRILRKATRNFGMFSLL